MCQPQQTHQEEKFNSKELIWEHWQKCHDIELTDVFEPFVLPDATKEPTPMLRLPSTVKGDSGRTRQVPLVARPVNEPVGALDIAFLDTHDED